MPILVQFVGLVIGALGLAAVLSPQRFKKVPAYWAVGDKRKLNGFIRLIIGGVFIWSAPLCGLSQVILILGWIILASGVLLFFISLERFHAFLAWLQGLPDTQCRLFGLIPLTMGLLILYAA